MLPMIETTEGVSEYIKFLDFVRKSSEPFKSQLSCSLYPIFVHVYLQFVKENAISEAKKFYSEHHQLFMEDVGHEAVVEDLKKLTTIEGVENDPNFKTFWKERFVVNVSQECFDYLKLYLENSNSILLSYLLSCHYAFRPVINNEPSPNEGAFSSPNDAELGPGIDHEAVKPPQDKNILENERLDTLNMLIEDVSKGSDFFPDVVVYSYDGDIKGLTTMDLSPDESLLAGSFEDSRILLHSILPIELPSYAPLTNISLPCSDPIQTHNVTSKCIRELKGHTKAVHGLCFTPCSSILLSTSSDATVRAWNTESCENVALYGGHNNPICDIDISSESRYFVSGSMDGTARLFVMDRLDPLKIMAGHTAKINCVKFHPSCNYVATGSNDCNVRLWDIRRGNSMRLFSEHKLPVDALAFSPDGRLLASSGQDGHVKIWDISSGLEINEICNFNQRIIALNFNNSGSLLAFGGLEKSLQIWDFTSLSRLADYKKENQVYAEYFGEYLVVFRLRFCENHVVALAV